MNFESVFLMKYNEFRKMVNTGTSLINDCKHNSYFFEDENKIAIMEMTRAKIILNMDDVKKIRVEIMELYEKLYEEQQRHYSRIWTLVNLECNNHLLKIDNFIKKNMKVLNS